MNRRTLSYLVPPLVMAAAIVAASALLKASHHAAWGAVAGPLVLVLALLGIDVAERRRSGRRPLPSPSALALSALLLAACGIVASSGIDHLAEMMPVFGACAALPAIQRAEGARAACRRA